MFLLRSEKTYLGIILKKPALSGALQTMLHNTECLSFFGKHKALTSFQSHNDLIT